MARSAGNITVRLDTHRLDMLRAGLEKKAEQVLEIAARNIEAGAKKAAPVDTGALRASIHVEPEPLGRIIADGVEYGVYVEFGTVHMADRPFLGPAVEAEREAFLEAWEALFR